MTTLHEAAQLALEALEYINEHCFVLADHEGPMERAIPALRAALAQEEQEPVCDKDPLGCWSIRCQLGEKCKNAAPPRCPNCASLEAQNTELDRKLAEMEKCCYGLDEGCRERGCIAVDDFRARNK